MCSSITFNNTLVEDIEELTITLELESHTFAAGVTILCDKAFVTFENNGSKYFVCISFPEIYPYLATGPIITISKDLRVTSEGQQSRNPPAVFTSLSTFLLYSSTDAYLCSWRQRL